MMEGTIMPRALSTSYLACALALLFACGDDSPCAIPGTAEACACAAAQGARVCGPEHIWSECNCSGAIPLPNPVTDLGGMGGATGGSSGSGGTSGVSGAGAGGGGGSMPPMDGGNIDEDGGDDLPDGGGTGGMTGGSGGSGGSGGMPPEVPPYGPCATNADCAPIGDCTITPNYPTDATVCAPRCVETVDCPVPAGMYEAVVTCVTGYCRIDCDSVAFQPLLSCPTGMTCIAPLFGTPWCHDDGI